MELKFINIVKETNSTILLIAPYGIEIFLLNEPTGCLLPFNRTLWN